MMVPGSCTTLDWMNFAASGGVRLSRASRSDAGAVIWSPTPPGSALGLRERTGGAESGAESHWTLMATTLVHSCAGPRRCRTGNKQDILVRIHGGT